LKKAGRAGSDPIGCAPELFPGFRRSALLVHELDESTVMRVDEIVDHYISSFRDALHEEMCSFKKELSLEYTIRRAALCVTSDGKRESHQRRLRKITLED
jgi:hypothetical protein